MTNQESFLSCGVYSFNADGDLLDYIKGFVYDKGGRCLKSEIIQSIMLNLVGIGINIDDGLKPVNLNENTFGEKWSPFIFNNRFGRGGMNTIIIKMNKLHEKLDEFENGTYVGTGLSVETSKMTGRKIYKYMDPERSESLIDLSSKFEVGVKVSNGNTKREPERTESLIDLSSNFEFGLKVSNGNTKRRQRRNK